MLISENVNQIKEMIDFFLQVSTIFFNVENSTLNLSTLEIIFSMFSDPRGTCNENDAVRYTPNQDTQPNPGLFHRYVTASHVS